MSQNTTIQPFAADDVEARKKSLGASAVATVAGLNKWQTPLQYWLRRRGELSPIEETEAMWWGTKMEPVIAERYQVVTGAELATGLKETFFQKGVITGHVDFLVLDAHGNPSRILECKMWNGRNYVEGYGEPEEEDSGYAGENLAWGDPGTDEVPLIYWVQCQMYMYLAEMDRADLAVYKAGDGLLIYQIDRNQESIDQLVKTGEEWWQKHVIEGERPEAIGDDAKHIRPANKTREAGEDARLLIQEFNQAKAAVKSAEDWRKTLGNRLKALMVDDVAIGQGDRIWATYKPQKRTDLDRARLKDRLGDEYESFLVESFTRVLRTKEVEVE